MREIPCNLCGSDSKKELFFKNDFRIVQCNNCGLAFVDPQPEKEEITRYYNTKYKERKFPSERKRNAKLREAKRLISDIRRILKNPTDFTPKLLDIGCGFGFVLKKSAEAGWDTFGIDIAEWMIEYGRSKFGIKAEVRNFPGSQLTSGSYDIITMLEVLEHFSNPRESLKESYGILREGGILVIRVPDFGSLPARKGEIQWRGIVLPDHLFFFTFRTLKVLLEDVGFVYKKTLPRVPWRDVMKVIFEKP